MKRVIRTITVASRKAAWLLPVCGVLLLIVLWTGSQKVYALPEYAERTNEPCAACHVNPGGGGPRTLRGLLWSARGKPDKVPELPGLLIAPRVSDGAELFQDGCAGCHGAHAEGRSAYGLVNLGIRETSIRSFIVHGVPRLGMPGSAGRYTDDQLDTLTKYVTGLNNGTIQPAPDRYPLPAGRLLCSSTEPACAGQTWDDGGN